MPRRRDVGEAGAVQRRHQEVARAAGAVAGEHAPGAVGAVRGRRERDQQHARARIAEPGHRLAPVDLVAKRLPLRPGDLARSRSAAAGSARRRRSAGVRRRGGPMCPPGPTRGSAPTPNRRSGRPALRGPPALVLTRRGTDSRAPSARRPCTRTPSGTPACSRRTPLTRNAAGRVRIGLRSRRACSGGTFSHHTWPSRGRTRCSGVKPSSAPSPCAPGRVAIAPSARCARRRCRRCSRRASACR